MTRRVFRPGRVCANQRALNSSLPCPKNSTIYKFVVADLGLRTFNIFPIFEDKFILSVLFNHLTNYHLTNHRRSYAQSLG
jgi:hypothetical protein